jgi:tetratricopeptide (TPR) repeat protein
MPDSAVLVFLVIGGAIGSAALVAAFFIGAGYLAELRLPRVVRQERAARRSAPDRGDDPLALALEAVRQGAEDTGAQHLRERATQAPVGPLRARAILALGYLAGSQGRYEEARQGYVEALKMAPSLAGTGVDLAGIFVRDGRDAAAEDVLTIALPVTRADMASREKAPLGYQLLGQILRRDERDAEAEELLRPALALYPGDPRLISAYGATLEALGRYDEAAQQYREGMRLAPNDAMLHGQLGGLLLRQGAFVQANTHLERSAELFPDRPTTRVSLAALKLKLGEWDAAEREAGAAVTLRPESAPAHANLGRALLQQGRLQEAERHGQRAVELAPNVGSAHALLGYALLAQGRDAEAQTQFRRALRLEPDLPAKLRDEAAMLDGMGLPASAQVERTHAEWLERASAGEGLPSR